TFHANIEEKNIPQTIASVADVVIHVHISENDRGTPGTGHVHWDETFRALREANYDNWLVIEAFGRALPDLAAATKVWRDLFRTGGEVYTKGWQFMKQKWAEAGEPPAAAAVPAAAPARPMRAKKPAAKPARRTKTKKLAAKPARPVRAKKPVAKPKAK